jgi:hypothetical protein
VNVEEGEVDGNEKNKKNYNVKAVISFHGRWNWNLSKMQK